MEEVWCKNKKSNGEDSLLCVVCCDAYQSKGGEICCNKAEELDFDKSAILKECDFSCIHRER